MKKYLSFLISIMIGHVVFAQSYLPLTGGTLTGNLELHSTVPLFRINGSNALLFRGIEFVNNSNVDASIKQLPVSGELQYSAGRTSDWGGFQTFYTDLNERMRITALGNVGIGTTTPDSKLTVAGRIHSQEVKVTTAAGADFVFEQGYNLRSLLETEKFIKQNKHLPEIASASEMIKDGINLGEMNIKLLQKIEELTLHLIEKDKTLTEVLGRLKKLEDNK